MNKLSVVLLAASCALVLTASAQDTNYLKTDIGVFETKTGVVLIRGFDQVGSLTAGTDTISVRTKETIDVSTGQKLYGLAIEIAGGPLPTERALVDDDEIDSLLNGINYLIKINYDVTAMPGFDASYTTKSGLRAAVHSIRRAGTIQHSLQYGDRPKILLTSIQISQLYDLIAQARKNLNALKTAK
jgi:hypothetical protein